MIIIWIGKADSRRTGALLAMDRRQFRLLVRSHATRERRQLAIALDRGITTVLKVSSVVLQYWHCSAAPMYECALCA